MTEGLPLGTVVGILSGVWLILLLVSAVAPKMTWKTAAAIISSLVAIPGFMLGGSWGTATILKVAKLDFSAIISWYLDALAISFLVVVALPLLRFVWRAQQIVQGTRHQA